MENLNYTPDRLIFCPEGRERWAEKQYLRGNFNTIEESEYASYRKDAKLCLAVAEEFRARMGKVIDIFLTETAIYPGGVKRLADKELVDSHDVIREDLLRGLHEQKVNVKIYTRCDRPALSVPEGLEVHFAVSESWENLISVYTELFDPNAEKEASSDFQVNLLMNYNSNLERVILNSDIFLKLTNKEQEEILARMLPRTPAADLILRTCPPEDDKSDRLNSRLIGPLAATSFMVIPKASPYVTREMVGKLLDEYIESNAAENLLDSSLWFRN